ncbi:putative K+/H+ antiporter [Aspergillus ellipticus CBS 707.79]|uniref:Putative K+/H+ antiporter n=1 Tax=Aspergillus ellipticus CBS 707.79 TaxID=1448320 RepID=A0A319D832_9EURO|nr:putative K+/H+ antiporter [Aspergillus ellipticus CBS 707.79]
MSNSTTTKVKAQGGILEGSNPTHYDTSNPIIIFIIQAGIIIIFCRLLHWPLSKIRQPRVIAEVIAGVLLGPSVMGRIPGFTDTIFPTASIPNLNLVANLGLVLFLFLVGLETNMRFLVSNWRVAISVSAAGMILPFGLGCAIAYGLYNTFQNEPDTVDVNFDTYLLFIGIAMAITAFPVLCRILTELKLLTTNVGVIVLSAGVGNDVVGWILLALCVALVNAGSGITALYVLLVCVGYILFLVFVFRPLFLRFLQRTGSLQKGPSQSVVAVTLLIALASAFFTQVIGIHAIFGGFIIGLLCPHEGGFAIKLTEKIEDLVAALFLPLYFTLSGLQTNLGLLDTGTVWGYVIGIIAIAFTAKVAGGALASRFCGLLWRESLSIGVLMSCKGLVELIVLNIGLQARILSTRTFTMFVVMALVTTFATTPLTVALYPKWYQTKVDRWRRGEIDWAGNVIQPDSRADSVTLAKDQLRADPVRKLLVYLRLDGLSSLCNLAALLGPNQPPVPQIHPDKTPRPASPEPDESAPTELDDTPQALHVHGVRLIELTDRDSSVMTVSELLDQHTLWDPVVNTFRAFGQWHDLSIMAGVSIIPEHTFADTVVHLARDDTSDLLLLPWSESGSLADPVSGLGLDDAARFTNNPYTEFVANVLAHTPCNTGLLIEQSLSPHHHPPKSPEKQPSRELRSPPSRSAFSTNSLPTRSRTKPHHILLPFFGGEDDRFALRFVLQLARNDQVTATVLHIDLQSPSPTKQHTPKSLPRAFFSGGAVSAGSSSTPHPPPESDAIFLATLRDSLPEDLVSRVVFKKLALPGSGSEGDIVAKTVQNVKEEMGRSGSKAGNMVVVGRRNERLDGVLEVEGGNEVEAGRVLGVLGRALLVGLGGGAGGGGVGDVLVLQSGKGEY